MLKITTVQTSGKITLQLEGSLSGDWVSELEDAWRSAVFDKSDCTVCVDLGDVFGVRRCREIPVAVDS